MIFAQLLFATLLSIAWPATSAQEPAKYGVDCSFPIHSKELRCGDILGDRKKVYEDFMQGCRDYYKEKADRCDVTEDERIEMSIRQPQSMVNYTSTGFKKIKAPKALFKLIKEHWEKNKDRKKQEVWPVGNIYVNHWEGKIVKICFIFANLN
jgi:hypothetical protein